MSIRNGKVFYVNWLFFGVFVAHCFAGRRRGLIGGVNLGRECGVRAVDLVEVGDNERE